MKGARLLGCTLLLLLLSGILVAQEKQKRYINFARGRSSAVIKGTWREAGVIDYYVRARAGQRMTVKLMPRSKDVNIIVAPGSFLPAPSPPRVPDKDPRGAVWVGKLDDTDEYLIELLGTSSPKDFTLTVTIE